MYQQGTKCQKYELLVFHNSAFLLVCPPPRRRCFRKCTRSFLSPPVFVSFFPYAYLTVTSPVTPCPLFLVNPPPCPSFPRQLVPLSTRPSGAQVCPPATTPSPPCRRTFARRLALLCPVGLARATCGSGGGRGGGGAEFSGLCVSLTIIFSWITNLFSYFAENIREYEETDC